MQLLGWTGLVRVDDGDVYTWLGNPLPDAPVPPKRSTLTNIQITPTRTILSLTAGSLDIIVTFLSPIEVWVDVVDTLAEVNT